MSETAVRPDTLTLRSDAGYVTLSIIENKFGPECWIHDVKGQGAGMAALLSRARRQAREWGFDEVWANLDNPRLAITLRDHGWTLEQVILKGKTHGGT